MGHTKKKIDGLHKALFVSKILFWLKDTFGLKNTFSLIVTFQPVSNYNNILLNHCSSSTIFGHANQLAKQEW